MEVAENWRRIDKEVRLREALLFPTLQPILTGASLFSKRLAPKK